VVLPLSLLSKSSAADDVGSRDARVHAQRHVGVRNFTVLVGKITDEGGGIENCSAFFRRPRRTSGRQGRVRVMSAYLRAQLA